MPELKPDSLAKVIRAGWKQLANADQTDVDEILKILRDTLEALEAIETPAN